MPSRKRSPSVVGLARLRAATKTRGVAAPYLCEFALAANVASGAAGKHHTVVSCATVVPRRVPPKHSRLARSRFAILLVLSLIRLRLFAHRARSPNSPSSPTR